ncbi:TPR repeat protein [Candidatus Moduliflexus flocculans]|uniref:TPR repeat protein n=1 Tax=Candidatus Moduliflexus flocculans TaxID=1499966 RepID=A0A081BMA5_9BACT|nr:TPR repeat protein [Candidatus Moduliflexus flocculans]
MKPFRQWLDRAMFVCRAHPVRSGSVLFVVVLLISMLFLWPGGAHDRAAAESLRKAQAYKDLKQYQKAEESFRAALNQDPAYIDARMEYGKFLYAQRRFRDGLKQFLALNGQGEDNYKLSALIGYGYEQCRHRPQAERWYRRAIEQDPNLTDTRLRLADMLEAQGRRQNAAELLREVLKINPFADDAEELEARSQLLTQADNPDAHYALADMYIRAGRISQGTQEYQAAVPFEEHDPHAMVEFAIFCLKRNQFATALTYFQKARDAGLDAQLEVRAGMGKAYEKLGKFTEAAQEYQAALQIDPEWHTLRLRIADILKKAGNPAAAANELEQIFYLSKHSTAFQLGTGVFPSVNALWEEILRLRGESSVKTILELLPSDRYPALIPAVANQAASVTLMVEPQAEYTILSAPLAERLGLTITPETSEVRFTLNGMLYSAPLVNLPSLKVGTLEVRNIPTLILNLSMYPGIDGLLGQSFLKHFRMEINYPDRLFLLTKMFS